MKRIKFILVALFGLAGFAVAFDGDPFFERVSSTNGVEFLAIRPLFSKVVDPINERCVYDYLWPVYTRKTFKDETYGRLWFFGFSQDFSKQEDDLQEHNWIFPIYFQGKNEEGKGYLAIFPVGGTVCNFIGRDEAMFVLFPLYGTSRINEVKTTSILWPVYSKTKGDKVDRYRIFPLFGRTLLEGEYDRRSLFWPFWTSIEFLHEGNTGKSFVLFPLYGRSEREKEKTTWILPPLFRFTDDDDQDIVHCPWPFYQRGKGDVDKFIMWPLFGQKQIGGIKKDYYAWPLLWLTTVDYPKFTHKRIMLAPVFAYESDIARKKMPKGIMEGDEFSKYWKLWPVMSWQREQEVSRFRMFEFWPFRNTPAVEHNWAPFWTLYRRESDGDQTGHHFLWGTYRQTQRADGFEWSLLKGLVGYKRQGSDKQLGLFFMSFGKGEVEP